MKINIPHKMSEFRKARNILEKMNAEPNPTNNPFCLTCFKIGTNVPCQRCKLIFYCSIECRDNNCGHSNECKEYFLQISDSDVQRAIHMALDFISTFGTMDEFVNHILHSNGKDVQPSVNEQKSKIKIQNQGQKAARRQKITRSQKAARRQKAAVIPQDGLNSIQTELQNETICSKSDLAYEIISKIPIIQKHVDEPSKILALKMLIMQFIRKSLSEKCKTNESKC